MPAGYSSRYYTARYLVMESSDASLTSAFSPSHSMERQTAGLKASEFINLNENYGRLGISA